MLREELADLAHEMWSGWMSYLFSKLIYDYDCNATIPTDLMDRWTRQINTKYSDLSEEEKDSDRKEADKMLSIFNKERS